MTWLDLYNFLYSKANDIHTVGTFDWNANVKVYDADTGDIYDCDTYYIVTENSDEDFVFIFNLENK